jgi:hypothetical protein
MKNLAVPLLLLSLFAVTAKADTLLDVTASTTGPFTGGSETSASLTFVWDTTTNVLSDFNLQTIGPLVFSDTPSAVLFAGGAIADINFSDAAGDLLQFDWEGNTSFPLQPTVGNNQPSVFDLDCASGAAGEVCSGGAGNPLLNFAHGQTVIKNVPEPQANELFIFGLLAVLCAFAMKARAFRSAA